MGRVLADAMDAKTNFRGPGPDLEADAYFESSDCVSALGQRGACSPA